MIKIQNGPNKIAASTSFQIFTTIKNIIGLNLGQTGTTKAEQKAS